MTKRTSVEPLLTAEMPGIEDIFPGEFSRMRDMPGYMRGTGTMTSFTIDAIDDAGAVEYRRPVFPLDRVRVRAMTFHTFAVHLFKEIRHHRRIPGTVAPAVERSIIGNG